MEPALDTSSYVIDGGRSGAARLAVLARVRASASEDFVCRAGLRAGDRCLDLGCGSGELTLRLADLAAPGEVVGIDFDPAVVAVARERAMYAQTPHPPRFLVADVAALPDGLGQFDLVSARYLLSHVRDPWAAVQAMWSLCRPGGAVALEDTDVDAMSSDPACPALERCVELNHALTRARGLVPRVGPQLVDMLAEVGFDEIEETVDQPAARDGDAKRMTELTLERKRAALLAEGLLDEAEFDAMLAELRAFTADPQTLIRAPRLHQVRGRRPPST
jgi:ubiquinone/menaquinone biosynthesis C-methylase UbiE